MARISELTKRLSDDPAFKEGYEQAQSNVQVGLALRALRDAKHLTQAEVAKLADLDQADISRIENGKWGKHGISHEVLERLLPVFGLRVSLSVAPLPGAQLSPAAKAAMITVTEMLAA